jgi:hypothetical protein
VEQWDAMESTVLEIVALPSIVWPGLYVLLLLLGKWETTTVGRANEPATTLE